jgi:hypothetical protein
MEHVIEIMNIIDNNKEQLKDGDYVRLCSSVKELYQIKKQKKTKLSLNRKMSILLEYLHDNDPEYIPIFTRPYTRENLRYAEYLCAYTTNVQDLYRLHHDHQHSSHYRLL